MLLENKYNQKMAEYVDDLTKQKEKTNEKAAFHDFIKYPAGNLLYSANRKRRFLIFC